MYNWWFYYMWHKVVGPVCGKVHSKLYIKYAAEVERLLSFDLSV